MATLRRLESESLPALLREAAKYPDWLLVGTVPTDVDGPPYVLLMRTAEETAVSEPEVHREG